jgi:hypothetical protein
MKARCYIADMTYETDLEGALREDSCWQPPNAQLFYMNHTSNVNQLVVSQNLQGIRRSGRSASSKLEVAREKIHGFQLVIY